MEKILSTYRLQFHKDFSFAKFKNILPYLKKMGITTIYASPIFKSVTGSNHGYDILDPNIINPEIGDAEEFENIISKLKAEGITWIQDIVPNHMAFFPENPWVMDVLEKGSFSIYSNYFDIAWNDESWQGRLMLPFLGKNLQEAIEEKELNISYKQKRLFLSYYDSAYPVQPRSYSHILQNCKDRTDAMEQFILQLHDMHRTEDQNIFHSLWNELLLQFESIMSNEKSGRAITAELEKINNNKEYLTAIANEQHYRLCYWQETDGQINYRRFFTVNSLICLNIQDQKVLAQHHQFIFSMVEKGLINGLRIDHIDGLADPTGYLETLRQKTGPAYIVVEKILEPGEHLPGMWPVQGSTGYDFLSLVNNLLTLKGNEESFTRFYNSLVQDHRSIAQQIRDKKAMILYHHMGGELENLFSLLMNSGLVNKDDVAEMRTEDLKTVIAEFLIHCPVYRFYGNSLPLEESERDAIHNIFLQLKTSRPDLSPAAALLENIFLHNEQREISEKNSIIRFYQRCMQFAGPLMAKGVEDTLMYTYNRFIAHNEVGDAPESFGISPKEFHKAMMERQKHWPDTMNATSTHDTKRGEDVRARLNVLSQLPQEWIAVVESWMEMNAQYKTSGAPDVNDEYFIYQTLIGTWPNGSFSLKIYTERIQEYFIKAFREAKRFSTWTKTNEVYEEAVRNFVSNLLDEKNDYISSIHSFVNGIIDHGIINSLNQLTLKSACPGVPDFYQGCELWDLSLVDPDNRRAVDYKLRENYFDLINGRRKENFIEELWADRSSGKIKLWLTQKVLELRKAHPHVFAKGDYIPLKAEGKFKDHVFSFARKWQKEVLVFVMPLHTALLNKKQPGTIPFFDWEDTKIILPESMGEEWENILEGKNSRAESGLLLKNSLQFSLAIFKGILVDEERNAGILLHISSLPSAFGIGDFGPEAFAFADQLNSAKQKYWQILPLNPVEKAQGNSPYSSTSSFAGNILFISPEILATQKLLSRDDLKSFIEINTDHVDFETVEEIKTKLLWKAFHNYKKGDFTELKNAFLQFRQREDYWLEDFESYMALKKINGGKPWNEWPKEFVLCDKAAISKMIAEQKEFIEWVGFTQFIFDQQWKSLKIYCNKLGIRIMGDLPFYISHDSADVWSHKELFNLDKDGSVLGMAGVPPDAFSSDGQLWGMPVYNWEIHKEKKYEWWKKRLEKNIELFDLLRLDHFRAFEAYWLVPAGEKTAKNGKWIKGPGEDFFRSVKASLGKLPFIAEDLGDISPEVYALRDEYSFPGMKVIQFAFGENFHKSEHNPHFYNKNFIAYTGTHDNNTLRGWIRKETDEATRSRIRKYLGTEVKDDGLAELLCRLAYGSVAKTVMLPIQDVLELDENSRINKPSLATGNWSWRLLPGQFQKKHEEKLREWAWVFGRD